VVFGKISLAFKLASAGVGKLLLELIPRFVFSRIRYFFALLATSSTSTLDPFLY